MLCSSADTRVVPPLSCPFEAGGDFPLQDCGRSLHQRQWLARPNSEELLSVVGLSAGKMPLIPQGHDVVECACDGREERHSDPGWFPSSEHPGATGGESHMPPQRECQTVAAFLLHHQRIPACPYSMERATYFLLPSIALESKRHGPLERARPPVCIFCKPSRPLTGLQKGKPRS